MPNNRSDAALRERLKIAGKATPGSWSLQDKGAIPLVYGPNGERIAKAVDNLEDTAHIAASSPDVVREDIEEILRLRGENKLLNSMVMSFAGKAVHETVGGWWTGWKGEKFLTKKAAIMSLIVKVKSELK